MPVLLGCDVVLSLGGVGTSVRSWRLHVCFEFVKHDRFPFCLENGEAHVDVGYPCIRFCCTGVPNGWWKYNNLNQVAIRNIRREAVDLVKKAEKAKQLGKDQVSKRHGENY